MDDVLKKIADTPAVALDKTVNTSQKVVKNFTNDKYVKGARDYWHSLGPGLTTGAADDDPSGITTYSQAGAKYGFQLLWLSGFTFPLMAVVQEMCARIGLVTGRGLAGNIRLNYSKRILYTTTTLLFIANTFNIGADLGAMAKAVQLIFPQISVTVLLIGFTFVMLGLQIFTSYERYARYLKWLALILFSYILSALSVNLNLGDLLKHTVIPSLTFSKEQIFLLCGVLGTTISPYLFFWQTSQEVEEAILHGKTSIRLREGTTKQEIKRMRRDVWSGMFISNLVMYFIIAACAATLFANGITNIQTTQEAAFALRPIAGDRAYLLFTLGVIGTGMLAIPILAGSASYAISESMKWRYGLNRKLREAPSFYGIIIIAMLIGLAMNFLGIDPIKALIFSAVLNGMIAPIILVQIVKLSSNKKIMGEWVNTPLREALGWYIALLMFLASAATIISFFL